MLRFVWTSSVVAGLLLASAATSRAQDVFRLGGPGAVQDNHVQADTQTLGFNGDVNTDLTHWGRGYSRGFYGGGFNRGFYGGGFYNRGYYGGGFYNRGFYGGGFYNRGFSYSYYSRPYYGGYSYYRPYYSGYYQPYTNYYTPSYYYSPCASTVSTAPMTVVLGSSISSYPTSTATPKLMPPVQNGNSANGNQTFPYDGGPAQPLPLPMPGADPSPTLEPKRPTVPLNGRLVSLPTKTISTYAAYGEFVAPARTVTPAPVFVSTTSATPSAATIRTAYPAYGER